MQWYGNRLMTRMLVKTAAHHGDGLFSEAQDGRPHVIYGGNNDRATLFPSFTFSSIHSSTVVEVIYHREITELSQFGVLYVNKLCFPEISQSCPISKMKIIIWRPLAVRDLCH